MGLHNHPTMRSSYSLKAREIDIEKIDISMRLTSGSATAARDTCLPRCLEACAGKWQPILRSITQLRFSASGDGHGILHFQVNKRSKLW